MPQHGAALPVPKAEEHGLFVRQGFFPRFVKALCAVGVLRDIAASRKHRGAVKRLVRLYVQIWQGQRRHAAKGVFVDICEPSHVGIQAAAQDEHLSLFLVQALQLA